MADDKREDRPQTDPSRRSSIRKLTRRLFGEGDESDLPEEEGRSTREMLMSAINTGDKARMEIIRLLAREVRGYLEALELHKDLHHLLTNYSLEVQASVSLKPLADAVAPPTQQTSAKDQDN
ncbi:MAG: hypothetical protein AAFV53_32990 [Myxococcota bacterium]